MESRNSCTYPDMALLVFSDFSQHWQDLNREKKFFAQQMKLSGSLHYEL